MASSKSLRFNLDCCLKKGGQQKDLNILKMHIAAVLRMTMNLYIHNINSQGGLHKYYIFIIGVVRGGGGLHPYLIFKIVVVVFCAYSRSSKNLVKPAIYYGLKSLDNHKLFKLGREAISLLKMLNKNTMVILYGLTIHQESVFHCFFIKFCLRKPSLLIITPTRRHLY